MATYNYMIGLTYGGLVNVEDLRSSAHEVVPPPKGMTLEHSSVTYRALDGRTYGDGYPMCVWEFDYLSSAAFNEFLEFLSDGLDESVEVYIRTRDPIHSSYDYYTAIMHKPRIGEDCTWEPGGWKDVKFKFTHMTEYTPSPPPP